MKSVLLLFSLFAFNTKPVSLLVIDMNGKTPPRHTTEFSMEQYLSRHFPIYASDLKVVINATVQAAKLIDRKPPCEAVDTIAAAHTLIIIHTECANGKELTVRYVTKIEEQNFLCDFEVLKKAEDFRAAQEKLIDFASYLSQ